MFCGIHLESQGQWMTTSAETASCLQEVVVHDCMTISLELGGRGRRIIVHSRSPRTKQQDLVSKTNKQNTIEKKNEGRASFPSAVQSTTQASHFKAELLSWEWSGTYPDNPVTPSTRSQARLTVWGRSIQASCPLTTMVRQLPVNRSSYTGYLLSKAGHVWHVWGSTGRAEEVLGASTVLLSRLHCLLVSRNLNFDEFGL